jgi:hypothetical protein
MRKKFRGKKSRARLVMSPCTEFVALAQKSNLLAHDSKTFRLGLS